MLERMNFNHLVHTIQDTHLYLQAVAAKAINMPMTIRNWLIGYYIVEFEQSGEDRAKYGDKLIKNLEQKLYGNGFNGFSFTNLNLYRQFYLIYPEIVQTVSGFLKSQQIIQTASEQFQIRQTLSDKLTPAVYEAIEKLLLAGSGAKKYGLPPDKLLKSLSFSHFVELVKIDDDLKRAFYEIECAKGVWSVRDKLRNNLDAPQLLSGKIEINEN